MPPNWLRAVHHDGIDWNGVESDFPFVEEMRACIQDSVHHAEGDVWTHTRMVAEQLPSFGLTDRAAHLTALFHDVEKPSTRIVEDGHVRHPRHARYGARRAWETLWRMGEPYETRMAVYGLVLWHQRIFHLWDYDDMQRQAQSFAAIGDLQQLIAFARADNAGRICADPAKAETNLVLLSEWAAETVVDMTAATRMAYLAKEGRSALYEAPEPLGSRVFITSGLPGAGKDYHVRHNHPGAAVISLDDIRRELRISWEDEQGRVIQCAYERARTYLRRREPFVWNATCLTRLLRTKIIDLCRAYDAHVTIDVLDTPYERVFRQNSDRDAVVPEAVICNMIESWEPPTLAEAHAIRVF